MEPQNGDELDGTGEAGDATPGAAPRRRGTGGGSMMAAAMLAVGEILEPQKTHVEIEEEAPGDLLDPPDNLELDFGHLPDL